MPAQQAIFQEEKSFPTSLLISNLQKCIRRNEIWKALATAKWLLKKTPNKFWRRMAVIIPEDVMLCRNYRAVVDLAKVSARKAYTTNKEDMQFGLELTEQMTNCKVRDVEFLKYTFQKKSMKGTQIPGDLPDPEQQSLVSALRYRSAMGSTSSDIGMLIITSRIWQKRFLEGYRLEDLEQYFPKPEMDYSQLPEKETSDAVLLESVDYHCSPIVDILLRKKYIVHELEENFGCQDLEKAERVLKDIIWRMRSATNYKRNFSRPDGEQFYWLWGVEDKAEIYRRTYGKIKTEIDKISAWFIKQQLTN